MKEEKQRTTGRRAPWDVEAGVERGLDSRYGHGGHGPYARWPECQDALLALELASRGRHRQALERRPAQALAQP
jgi:hypothetical protein